MAHVGGVGDRRRRRLPGFFSVAMLNTIIKKQFGEKKVYFSLQVTAHHQWKRRQEPEVGTWKEELKQRSWRDAAY